MDHPTPAETQPPLTWRSQAWRLAVCALISALVWSQAIEGELESHRVLFWVEVLFGIAAYVLVVMRRRAPVTIAMVVAPAEHVLGHRGGPGDPGGGVRRDAAGAVVGGPGRGDQRGRGDDVHLLRPHRAARAVLGRGRGQRRRQRRDDGLGPLPRLPSGAPVDAAAAGGPGRGRAGAAGLAGPRHRARADRPRDARRARPPDHPGVHALGRAGLPRRPRRRRAARGAHPDPGQGQRGAARAARGARRAPRRQRRARRPAAAALRRHRGDDRRGAPERRPRRRTTTASTRAGSRFPDAAGRTLYRIVQEGLTNASKHAPGAHVTVEVAGDPEQRPRRGDEQPARLPRLGRARCRASASSASPSAPSSAAGTSSTAGGACCSCCAGRYRGRHERVERRSRSRC